MNRNTTAARGRASSTAPGRVRLIGGQWRGRRLRVIQSPELRPSGDRLRETLFNWLQPTLVGARCLDLFAGSGVLGLEAVSRGAARVDLVEKSPLVANGLASTLAEFDVGDRAVLHCCSAETFLSASPTPYDVVFIDPPFDRQQQLPTLQRLTAGWLAPGARVHVEDGQRDTMARAPSCFRVHREKRFGDVFASLLVFEPVVNESIV